MNGLTPGLDRSPPPRWMGGQGGQSLKVFGRTRSFWGLSSPKIEMGGKALKWLSRLDYPLAKTGETVNGGAVSAVHLTVDWIGWLCYLPVIHIRLVLIREEPCKNIMESADYCPYSLFFESFDKL